MRVNDLNKKLPRVTVTWSTPVSLPARDLIENVLDFVSTSDFGPKDWNAVMSYDRAEVIAVRDRFSGS